MRQYVAAARRLQPHLTTLDCDSRGATRFTQRDTDGVEAWAEESDANGTFSDRGDRDDAAPAIT